MDVKRLEKEMESIMKRATKDTTDFNEIMNKVLTKYNISQDLVLGWLGAYLEKYVKIDTIKPDEVLFVGIDVKTPTSIINSIKKAIDIKGLGNRVFYAPSPDIIKKMNKDTAKEYVKHLENMID